jgi:type IV pilus assembly protein PilY1
MKKNLLILKKILLPLIILTLARSASPTFAAMDEYCVSPPFLEQSISPNILIILDNSYSMCDQAYPSSFEPSQFANGFYYGYFDGAKNYKYNGSRWVTTTDLMSTGTVANPIASGNFLNWATMRRTEVSKKLLVGGKGNPRSPSPGQTVKLDAETACGGKNGTGAFGNFEKTFDVTGLGLIYPFNGKYKFKMEKSGELRIEPGYVKVYATGDRYGAAKWYSYPGTPSTKYDKINEISHNDSNYISNDDNTPIIFNFNYTDVTPPPSPGSEIDVILHVRAVKTVNQTRKIRGVIQLDGINYSSSSEYPLTNKWADYSIKWDNAPDGSAWTWDQITKQAGKLLNGFGVQSYNNTRVYISQVYLEIGIPPLTPTGGPYRIIVDQGMVEAEGIIYNLDQDVRFGLAYYNDSINNINDNGGRIQNEIGFDAPGIMTNSIEDMVPSTNTPLGESLYEMVRYFRQDSPYYPNSPANYSLGFGDFGEANIYGDPYAYKFKDVDPSLTNMYVKCAKSFILFLTDGESTRDQSMVESLKGYSAGVTPSSDPNERFAGTTVGTTYSNEGTDYMIDVAYWARTADMRPGTETDVPTTWRQSLPGIQNVFLYPIFMFGTGSSLLKDAAIYGGFEDNLPKNNKPDCTTDPAECYRDTNGDGTIKADGSDLPLTYYEGNDGYQLEKNIKDAIEAMLNRAASSTAVSMLNPGQGSGANVVQSLFYPKRSFTSSAEITWISDVMNYWYYLDPYFKNSQIREDTVRDEFGSTILDLKTDYISQFYFDAEKEETRAARCADTNGNGDCDDIVPGSVPIEETKAIWRAGVNLWWTEAVDRKILTSLDGSTLITFDTSNVQDLDDYLGLTASDAAANATIDYVRGVDIDKLCSVTKDPCSTDTDCIGTDNTCVDARSRTAPMNVCTESRNPCSTTDDCGDLGGDCMQATHTWKLGDVISSTPRIMGPSPLNNYNIPPPIGYADTTYRDFVKTVEYQGRQRVFVGSNDGMFHAFRLGKLEQRWDTKEWWQPGRIVGTTGKDGIGTESWAFIPKNVLPYLQYLSDPDYCHIYMVDGPVSLVDASISLADTSANCTESAYWDCAKQPSSWRSIAIGSMGIGGATSSVADSDCIQTPLNVGGTPVGWSSYFALNVTDQDIVTNQDTPKILWEFNHPDLGVTNVGPAIVKVGNKEKRCDTDNSVCTTNSTCGTDGQCVGTNGRWFAILASGSTGPIIDKNFKGTSDQTLKLFILDLKTGDLLRTIDTGIANAFAGSISSSTVDLERGTRYKDGHYHDDVVYIGYVQDTTKGGVIRLVMNDDIETANWTTSKVIDNIGPVTTTVVNLLDRKSNKLWLYFAEGRYFDKQDDIGTTRKLFGIQEPCYVKDTLTNVYDVLPSCSSATTLSGLKNQSSAPTALSAIQTGWYVELDPVSSTNLSGAERVISNPTPDVNGAIYFLSFAPTSDICGFGGTTYVWALDYKTGGQVTYTMQGKALVQVSTGEIKEIDMSTAFTARNSRRTVGFTGIPPVGQGLMVIVNPSPIRQYMHIQEQ